MAFIFSSSHFPQVKRPEEEEEDDEGMQPMPRSGGVRAFSHLPEHPEEEENVQAEDDMQPMPRSGSVRAFSHLPEHPEEEENVQAEDDMQPTPRSGSVRAFSHLPERTGDNAEDELADADSLASLMPPAPHGRDDEDSYGSSFPNEATASAQKMPGIFGDPPESPANHDVSRQQDAPPETPPSSGPQSDTPQATASASRLFEQRQAPGASATQQQQVRGPNPPSQDGRFAAQAHVLAQAQRPAAAPAQNAPAARGGGPQRAQAPAAPPAQPPAAQPSASEGQSLPKPDLSAPRMRITKDPGNPYFDTATRAALADEADNSPTAAALQREADRLGIQIVPQKGLFMSQTKLENGRPVIHFNPRMKTDTSLSHEIAHAIQMAAFQAALDKNPGDLNGAIKAGRDALNAIVPVKSDLDQGQDYKENEAMRVAHIVGAERTATEMKNLPEEQKTLEEFLRRQKEKEDKRGEPEKGRKHPNNDYPMPAGTERGKYDYKYVRDILGLDEKGQKKPKPPSSGQPLPPSQSPPPPRPSPPQPTTLA